MLNDPYFRDKPEMVDILLDNNMRKKNTLPMWNSTLSQTKEDEKILRSYLKSQGARVPAPPPPPPPSDPKTDGSPQARSPKKTIVELTTSFIDTDELDPYDRYLLKKQQRQDVAVGAGSSEKNGTKLSYAQKHRRTGNSTLKQKRANTAIRRNTTISPQKKIQLLKKSRTMYSEHSIQFAKQKVEEQKKKEKLNQFYSSRDFMTLDSLLQTSDRQGDGAELLEGMANLTWVDDVDLEDIDGPAQQVASETKGNRKEQQRNTDRFDEETRMKELNNMIRETRSSKDNAEFRKRESYMEIQSRALNQQMRDDLVASKKEGDRIGKQAPSWIIADADGWT